MRSTVLVLILATTFVVAFDFNKAVQAYTATQNAMDAQAATSLFAPNATVYMPFPSSVQGTKQILAAYAGFFAQVKWMNETVSSPLEINTNWVAYMVIERFPFVLCVQKIANLDFFFIYLFVFVFW